MIQTVDLIFYVIYNDPSFFNKIDIYGGIMSNTNEKKDNKVLSITEAAKLNKVTRQAIYVAIKLNKLKARKEASRWVIEATDLEQYKKDKYSRTKSMFDGELLFDNIKGYYSIRQVAKLLNVPAQKIYYATRAGYIKGTRKGAAWVIHQEEIETYAMNYLQKKTQDKKEAI